MGGSVESAELARYDGKPFLRLLEGYVLSSIGHLEARQDHALSMLAPELSEAFGFRGSWFEIVEHQMEFPSDLPSKIHDIWKQGADKAEALGLSVDPYEFTRQFVDTNWNN